METVSRTTCLVQTHVEILENPLMCSYFVQLDEYARRAGLEAVGGFVIARRRHQVLALHLNE